MRCSKACKSSKVASILTDFSSISAVKEKAQADRLPGASFFGGDRRLELHFRFSLGLVSYRIGEQSASHEAYMRELGVWAQCNYPGFSQDPLAGFEHLAHDLEFAEDFLAGSAEVLRRAAIKEAAKSSEDSARLMAAYVGDVQKIEQLRALFREGRFSDVVTVAAKLEFPSRLTASEQKMIRLAREKAKAQ